jgi:hypothetical protein
VLGGSGLLARIDKMVTKTESNEVVGNAWSKRWVKVSKTQSELTDERGKGENEWIEHPILLRYLRVREAMRTDYNMTESCIGMLWARVESWCPTTSSPSLVP